MTLIRFCLVALAFVGGSSAYSAPITYEVMPSHNADLAKLDWGYFTTDGTVGQGIHLGTILVDYKIKITEGPNTLIMTPANTIVSSDRIAFDITPDSITIPDNSAGLGSDIFRVRTGGMLGFTIQHRNSSAEAWIVVSLDGTSTAQEQPLPLVVARAIPEPTSLALAAMLAGCGLLRRRPNN
jgi:hypothetical protein